jgi:hypothetical protein
MEDRATMSVFEVRRGASRAQDAQTAVAELHAAIAQPDCELVLFYCSPDYDRDAIGRAMREAFPGVQVVGCTTAGEIGPLGYVEGTLSGVSLAGDGLRVAAIRLDGLRHFEPSEGAKATRSLIARLEESGVAPSGDNTFGFLLIDGLCGLEEIVVSSLYRNLGDIQLVGGSAGDGQRFGGTYIYHDGAFHQDAAVFLLVQTRARFEVFKTQHFERATEKMVVTGADPMRRVVTEINGEPAGHEYARVVGVEVDELTPMVFGCHPVVVRMGGQDYVRSIQKVNADGSLTFFCAIDEGIVLTTARRVDLVENLEGMFAEIRSRIGEPAIVLGCDCILRHLECEQRGEIERVGRIYRDNNVIGFATYGEQYNAMHVNQTFTGVAIAREVA